MPTRLDYDELEARVARLESRVRELTRPRAAAPRGHLSAAEAADLLGVAESTVRDWCRTGRLRALKLGRAPSGGGDRARQWRVPVSAVEALLPPEPAAAAAAEDALGPGSGP